MANAELPAAKSEASAADAEDLGAHPQVSTPKRACAFAKSNMRRKRARRTRKEVPIAGEFFDELQITCEDDVLQKAIKKLLSGMPVEVTSCSRSRRLSSRPYLTSMTSAQAPQFRSISAAF